MDFYKKYILPKLLNSAMKRVELEKQRPEMVAKVSGIVLEVGFGSGLNLPYYKNITKLYALDPSQELYELAQEKIKTIVFPIEHLRAFAENIPLRDNTVDAVVSTWSLCSIPDLETALKEIYRVLKPDGKFVFIEHGKSPKQFTAILQKILTPFSKCISGGCHMDRDMEKLIIKAGFEIGQLEKFQEKSKPLAFMYKGVVFVRK